MSLSDKQWIFLQNVGKLISFIEERGWKATGGELFRTHEQQKLHFASGKSKTMKSQHLSRLAIDLNLFIDGKYRQDKEAYKECAEFWQSLHPDNRAGYFWGWDANHFEMKS